MSEEITFAVAVDVPDAPEDLAAYPVYAIGKKGIPQPEAGLCCVFWLGEILVLDEDGREIGGQGRKPSKWNTRFRYFDSIEGAVACVRELEAS